MSSRCVVLSSAFPDTHTGTGFAARSILPVLLRHFDKVEYVAVAAPEKKPPESFPGDTGAISYHHIKADTSPKWKRFGRSLFSVWPGTVQRYVRMELPVVLSALAETAKWKAEERCPTLVVLDAPLYWALLDEPDVRKDFGCVIHWSQNVSAQVFQGLRDGAKGPMRRIWEYEIRRLQEYEKKVLLDADVNWTITKDDAETYRKRYGVEVDGVVGIRLEAERFQRPIGGDPFTLMYLGSFDIRKKKGIEKLVHVVFPSLKAEFPHLRLLLGGKGSEEFHDDRSGVEGRGFVVDEAEFMKEGMVAINPQESGSGIKLKSLHALAAGKVLLTTPVGVQGISGIPDRDYLLAERVEDMGQILRPLLQAADPERELRAVAEHGREAVRSVAEEKAFDAELLQLLQKAESRERAEG